MVTEPRLISRPPSPLRTTTFARALPVQPEAEIGSVPHPKCEKVEVEWMAGHKWPLQSGGHRRDDHLVGPVCRQGAEYVETFHAHGLKAYP